MKWMKESKPKEKNDELSEKEIDKMAMFGYKTWIALLKKAEKELRDDVDKYAKENDINQKFAKETVYDYIKDAGISLEDVI